MRTDEHNIRLVWLTLLGILVACGLVLLTNWLADGANPAYTQPAFPSSGAR